MSSNNGNAEILPLFSDAILKLEWSAYKIRRLQAGLQAYIDNGIQSSFAKDDSGKDGYVLSVRAANLDEPTALVVGDTVRNIRGSLDHAISAMYRKKGLRDDNVYFPIGDSRESLAGTIKGGLEKNGFEALTPLFLDEIEATQATNSPIWQLNQIDRANKHRALVIIEEILIQPLPNFVPRGGGFFYGNATSLRPGQQISVPMPEPAEIIDQAHTQTSLRVTFGPSEIFAGKHVVPTLVNLQKATVQVLQKLSDAYKRHYL